MERAPAASPRSEEIAEALPIRAAAISRLFMAHTTAPISRTEMGVLYVVSEQPRRITELAAREGVTQPAITLLVNRLAERGWLKRTPDPLDGRAVLVELTPAGSALLDQVRAEFRALVREEMAMLDDDDIGALARAVEILDGMIDRLEDRSR
ncbi:MAG: MarR family winged helix-turn-helix transcriptional regulator [Solirubrobacteraceae bacterium]